MAIFTASTFLPRFQKFFSNSILEIIFLLWFFLGSFNDVHYMTPLILYFAFLLLTYRDFKKGYLLFVNELRFNDNKKILEVIYSSGFCKKMKKKIPCEFLYYELPLRQNERFTVTTLIAKYIILKKM